MVFVKDYVISENYISGILDNKRYIYRDIMVSFLLVISTFITYFFCFKFILKKLEVKGLILKRALILTTILVAIQVGSGFVAEIAMLDDSAAVIMTIILFALILRRFVILESWKAVVIPIVIPILGQLAFAISLMVYIGLFGSIKI